MRCLTCTASPRETGHPRSLGLCAWRWLWPQHGSDLWWQSLISSQPEETKEMFSSPLCWFLLKSIKYPPKQHVPSCSTPSPGYAFSRAHSHLHFSSLYIIFSANQRNKIFRGLESHICESPFRIRLLPTTFSLWLHYHWFPIPAALL